MWLFGWFLLYRKMSPLCVHRHSFLYSMVVFLKHLFVSLFGCLRSQWRHPGYSSHHMGLALWHVDSLLCRLWRTWAQLLHGMWDLGPSQGSNPCHLHCKADSQPLDLRGSLSFMVYHRISNLFPCAIQQDLIVHPFSI